MRTRQLLLCGGVWLVLAGGLVAGRPAQAQEAKTDLPEALRIAQPMDPMPTLEVVTVRKTDGKPVKGLLVTTMRPYFMAAFSLTPLQTSRVIGAPSWLDSQPWVVNGKPSDELREAMKTMPAPQLLLMNQMLRRSVLVDQFKLKSHIETRQLPYYELVAAKGGIKVKEVPAFVLPAPGGPPAAPPKMPAPGDPPRPGMMFVQSKNGSAVLNAGAVDISRLASLLTGLPEIGGRPVVDKTGFKGSFDLVDFPLGSISMGGGMNGDAAPPAASADAPSIFTTVEEKLGMKLVATKGPVEVVVIDSIEEPAEN